MSFSLLSMVDGAHAIGVPLTDGNAHDDIF
jgi:hypothetical protein